jgi:hypothetical protein
MPQPAMTARRRRTRNARGRSIGRCRFGGVKKELGRLFGEKGAEKHGSPVDDKPVPDEPNVQATHTVAKRAPGVPNVQATHTVANVLNAGDDNLPLILNVRAKKRKKGIFFLFY